MSYHQNKFNVQNYYNDEMSQCNQQAAVHRNISTSKYTFVYNAKVDFWHLFRGKIEVHVYNMHDTFKLCRMLLVYAIKFCLWTNFCGFVSKVTGKLL